jgi:hypothetical protein
MKASTSASASSGQRAPALDTEILSHYKPV